MKSPEKNKIIKKKLAGFIKRGTFREAEMRENEHLRNLELDAKILKINKGNIWDRGRLQRARKGYQKKMI